MDGVPDGWGNEAPNLEGQSLRGCVLPMSRGVCDGGAGL